MSPELRQLRYFVAVAEDRSFTRAAARLHLSQQALSAAIRSLEQQLGTVLLLRGLRDTTLTAAGETLLRHARRVIEDAESLGAAMRAHRDGTERRLRLGLLLDGAGPLTAPLLAAFRAAHPTAALSVRQLQPSDGLGPLLDGRVDVALVHGPQDDDDRLALTELFTVPRVAVVAERSPLADAASLAAADLLDQPVATRHPGVPEAWEGFFTLVPERGGQPERLGDPARTFDEVLWNVSLRGVVLTLPAQDARRHPAAWYGVRYVPVPDLPAVPYYLARRRDDDSDLAADLLDLAVPSAGRR